MPHAAQVIALFRIFGIGYAKSNIPSIIIKENERGSYRMVLLDIINGPGSYETLSKERKILYESKCRTKQISMTAGSNIMSQNSL